MPEDQQGQEDQVVEEANDQGEEQPEELSASEEPTEEPVEGELPEDAKERTKREFEKLKKHNAELKEQLEQRKNLPSVLDYLTPEPRVEQTVSLPQMPPMQLPQAPQVSPTESELVNEEGYVNVDVLRRELDEAKRAIKDAEDARKEAREAKSRISKYEQDAETERLYKSYPELNPLSEEFNQDAYELVRNELTSQIVNSGSRDAIKAADKMSKFFRQQPKQNQKVVEQRAQVSTPGTTRQPEKTNFEELKLRSRRDPDALFERLQRSGY